MIPNNKEFSYRGPDPGISGNFIKNTNGIELICFSHYPIGNGPSCSLSTSWNGTGWSNGAPNPYTTATINANYSTQNHGSITSCDCEISNNATLTISDNDYLAISGNFIINGIFDLKDDASLYMFNDDTQITYNGSSIIHKKSTPLNDSYDFTYWSSPVENDIISNVFTGVDPSRIFYWETPITGNPGYWVNSNQSDVLISGKGYISEAPVNVTQHNLTFTGRPNTGVITLNLGYDSTNGAAGGYNLIGNPYPSSIDILKFLDHSQNSFLDGTIWLWTHATPYSNGEGGSYTSSDYATFNRTGGTSNNPNVPAPQNNIASAQGFFVKALQSGTIRFDNEMRLTNQNNIFFKNNKKKSIKDRIWLNVFGQKNKHFNQILIGFSSQTTDLFDKSYDGLKFSSGYISLYSKINNDKYAIQSLGEFNQSKEVTIGFDTYQKDTYTISIGKLEGELENNDIYLYDNELNILHDLKNANYEFEAVNTGSFSDRFILKFNNTVLSNNEPNASSTVLIRQVDSSILIESPASELKSLVVYDMLGRNIFENRRINKKSLKINVSKDAINSIYIVSVTLKSGHTLNKKIIVK